MIRNQTTTVGTYVYGAFGRLEGQAGTDISLFKFSSKELDTSTTLYYFGHRFYSPVWQRWISSDPVGRDGRNVFRYVGNQPITFLDPLGLFKVCIRPLRGLSFTTAIVHCYIDAGNDGTFSFDDKGIHSDPDPNNKDKKCTEAKCCKKKGSSDLLDKINSDKQSGKWDAGDYRLIKHNCCHWIDNVLKALGCEGIESHFPPYSLPTHPANY
jgi:RHS repeat-associated protein